MQSCRCGFGSENDNSRFGKQVKLGAKVVDKNNGSSRRNQGKSEFKAMRGGHWVAGEVRILAAGGGAQVLAVCTRTN